MHWNNSFLMCSTTDSTTPKTDMSHNTRTLLLSLAAGRLLPSPCGACKGRCSRRHRSVCIAVRIRACTTAHAPNHSHGASCVDPDDAFCTELQLFTGVSSALRCPAPFLRAVYSGVLPIVKVASLVATNATIGDGLAVFLFKKTTTYHFFVERNRNIPLWGTQALPVSAIRRHEGSPAHWEALFTLRKLHVFLHPRVQISTDVHFPSTSS